METQSRCYQDGMIRLALSTNHSCVVIFNCPLSCSSIFSFLSYFEGTQSASILTIIALDGEKERPLINGFLIPKPTKEVSYSEVHFLGFYTLGLNFGRGLLKLGCQPKSFFGIYSQNRYEWILTELGMSGCHLIQALFLYSLYTNLMKVYLTFLSQQLLSTIPLVQKLVLTSLINPN